MNQSSSIQYLVLASLMAALIASGAFLAIPIGPVPVVLQDLFVLLAGLLLGSRWGAASVAVYLLAGACGLPVFAGGGGGLGHLLGPRGGYLVGFLVAAYAVGLISERSGRRLLPEIAAMLIGSLVIFAMGVPWLKMMLGLSMGKALAVGFYPFIPASAVKIAAAVTIARHVRPLIHLSGQQSNGINTATVRNQL